MASEAEVDLVISTEGALAELERDLEDIIRAAEDDADAIRLDAELSADIAELDAEIAALVADLERSAPEVDIQVDIDEDGKAKDSVLDLGKAFKSVLGPLAGLAGGIGKAGLAAGAALPLLAGVLAAVQSLAPAAAVAVTGLIAVQLATNTVKLAMIGVKEAIAVAFDPEAGPEELAKALEKLAPSAKSFVLELRSMRSQFKALQQSVQQNFFANFDKAARELGKTALPVLSKALQNTAVSLNRMALGAANAASKLAKDGVLGRALSGANTGLLNLEKVPGQLVTALGQLGAAAAPAFDRLTTAAANAATKISDRLTKAFETGKLEASIDKAIDALAQLGRSIGNIFEGLGNIFDTVNEEAGGLFFILEKITQAFADVTATKGFQDALTALVETAGVLVDEGLKLILQVLQELGPIFEELGPPIQDLIKLLGGSLGKIFEQLGPALVKLAEAFGKLVPVIEPFVVLATDMLVAVLPGLIPLFETLGKIFDEIAPFAKQLADNIGVQLLPFLQKLSDEVLPKLLPFFSDLAEKIFPKLTEVLVQLEPSLTKLGIALGDLLVQLVPLAIEIGKLAFELGEKLAPVIGPLIELIIKLVTFALALLTNQLVTYVIPAIEILVALLQGDFSAAWAGAQQIVASAARQIGNVVGAMKDAVLNHLRGLAQSAQDKAREIRDQVAAKFQEMKAKVAEVVALLPGVVQAGLAHAGTLLVRAGADIVRGLVSGIRSQLGALRDAAQEVASSVKDAVTGFLRISSPSKVMMDVGNDTIDGFRLGIAEGVPDLRRELQGVGALAPSFALPNGQTLRLPQFSPGAPLINVYLGNELINRHVDNRISHANQDRDRLRTQGVRR